MERSHAGGYGPTIFDVVSQAGHGPFELDSMIRGGRNPYDGLPDLVRRFCARPRGLETHGTLTVVELIAPLAVRFDRESVASTSERVTVALRAADDVLLRRRSLSGPLGRRESLPVMDQLGSANTNGHGRDRSPLAATRAYSKGR